MSGYAIRLRSAGPEGVCAVTIRCEMPDRIHEGAQMEVDRLAKMLHDKMVALASRSEGERAP